MAGIGTATAPHMLTARAAHCYSTLEEQRDVFESHRHHVFSVAYYMTGDEREAETILESSFTEAFEKNPKPSIDLLDQTLMEQLHQRLSFTPVEPMEATSTTSQGLGGQNVRRTELEEALWQLPTVERLCFLLRDVEGYSAARIAGLMQITEPEVQRTLLSSRMRIRAFLIEQASQRNS